MSNMQRRAAPSPTPVLKSKKCLLLIKSLSGAGGYFPLASQSPLDSLMPLLLQAALTENFP